MKFYYENKKNIFYCRDSSNGKNSLACLSHLHYHVELAFIFRGGVRAFVDSAVYDAEENDIILVFPNQVHKFESDTKTEDYLLFIFNPDTLPEFSKQFASFLPESNLIKSAGLDEETKSLAMKIYSTHFSEGKFKDTMLRGYLIVFFSKLFTNLKLKDIRTQDFTVLGTILNYCTNNSDKNLSLALLEKELHISKYYISHILRSKLDIGFNDYVNSIRVSKACEYLLNSDKSVTDISDLVGFNTLRTFNRAFLKQMGIPPSAYRSKKHGGILNTTLPY